MSNKHTVEYIKSILDCDLENGVFVWRRRTGVPAWWNTKYAGKKAGSHNENGYVVIAIDRKYYLAHRLVWFLRTGAWPKTGLDHENMIRDDNCWANLRLATKSHNAANRAAPKTNTSGWKGVGWDTRTNKWKSQITVNQERRYLGVYDCPAAAHLAYVVAASKAFGEYARAR